VAVAGHVEAALRIIEAFDCDIGCMFLDAQLAGQSAAIVADRPRSKDIPFVPVSGYEPETLRHPGFDGAHLPKPLNAAAPEAVRNDIACTL